MNYGTDYFKKPNDLEEIKQHMRRRDHWTLGRDYKMSQEQHMLAINTPLADDVPGLVEEVEFLRDEYNKLKKEHKAVATAMVELGLFITNKDDGEHCPMYTTPLTLLINRNYPEYGVNDIIAETNPYGDSPLKVLENFLNEFHPEAVKV